MDTFAIILTVAGVSCITLTIGAAVGYFAAARTQDDMNAAMVDAIDAALFKVDSDAKAMVKMELNARYGITKRIYENE